jgi:hypothetical protein
MYNHRTLSCQGEALTCPPPFSPCPIPIVWNGGILSPVHPLLEDFMSLIASVLRKTGVGEKVFKDSLAPNRIGPFPREDERVFVIHE